MKIVIFVYPGMTMLDAIGPYEVLRNLKDAEILVVSKGGKPVLADSTAIEISPKYSLEEITEADILLIPGSTIGFMRMMQDASVLQWIQKLHKNTLKTTSVCTGSLILAAAGILKNKKATSHWKPLEMLANFGAIPTRERIVEEGKIITAAGVSAGIDMALYLIHQLEGETVAKAAQLTIEYDPKPMFDAGDFAKASPEVIKESERRMELSAQLEIAYWKKQKANKEVK